MILKYEMENWIKRTLGVKAIGNFPFECESKISRQRQQTINRPKGKKKIWVKRVENLL